MHRTSTPPHDNHVSRFQVRLRLSVSGQSGFHFLTDDFNRDHRVEAHNYRTIRQRMRADWGDCKNIGGRADDGSAGG